MYVSAYSSRPVMHIKENPSTPQERFSALTFADAVARFGHRIDENLLLDAYRKAGQAFKGQLEQQFVVLKDLDVEKMLMKAKDETQIRGRPQFRGSYRGRPRGQSSRGGRGSSSRSAYHNNNSRNPGSNSNYTPISNNFNLVGSSGTKRPYDQTMMSVSTYGPNAGINSMTSSGSMLVTQPQGVTNPHSWYDDSLASKSGKLARADPSQASSGLSQQAWPVGMDSVSNPGSGTGLGSSTGYQGQPQTQAQFQDRGNQLAPQVQTQSQPQSQPLSQLQFQPPAQVATQAQVQTNTQSQPQLQSFACPQPQPQAQFQYQPQTQGPAQTQSQQQMQPHSNSGPYNNMSQPPPPSQNSQQNFANYSHNWN